MQTIFVQIKCEPGTAYRVADVAAQSIAEASETYSTSGVYDVLLKCCLPNDVDIGHFVTDRVQCIEGVRDTFTIITFKAFS